MRKIKPHSSYFWKIGPCLHQLLNQRKENLLWTPARRCTWSAKRIWIPLNWKPWRHQEVRWRLWQPMVKCRRMKRLQFVSESWIYSWRWNSSRIRQQFYRWESFAMNMDTHMSGSTVKNHISLKMVFEYSAIRKISCQSWFLVCQRVLPQAFPHQHPWHLQGRRLISPPMTSSTVSTESETRQERGDPCGIESYPATVWGRPVDQANQKSQTKKKTKTTI